MGRERVRKKRTYAPAMVSQAARPPSGGIVARVGRSGLAFSRRSLRLVSEMVVLMWRELAVAGERDIGGGSGD